MMLLSADLYGPPSLTPTHTQTLNDLVAATAAVAGVDPRALMVRARQQLPRVVSFSGRIGPERAKREIDVCAERLRYETRRAADHVPTGTFALSQLRFAEIDEVQAWPLLTHLHYLHSVRPGSRYFALLDPDEGLPVALCSVSGLQWPGLERKILDRFAIPPKGALDISRVFAVDSAPRNSISTLLSRVRKLIRRSVPDIELLTTVVDPNLGFTGTSYRAANWQQWMTIKARPYFYQNHRFVTPRQLRDRFGTTNFEELQGRTTPVLQRSRIHLEDSLLYCCRVRGVTESLDPERIPRLYR